MKPKIFIDGEHGTTGLQITDRLAKREDLEILSLEMEDRRNETLRKELFAKCDVAILCLPDEAAKEAVSMIEDVGNSDCRIIDTSTAHRTSDGWTYGFAEFDRSHMQAVREAKRVSNPGCYSTGAIALLKPLVSTGIMKADFPVTINAVSGYTGGGKQLIARMEDTGHENAIETAFHLYALGLQHKHVPEIMVRAGLTKRPIFTPGVGRFRQGMLVSIPVHLDMLEFSSPDTVRGAFEVHYDTCQFVHVASAEECAQVSHLKPEDFKDRDDMKLWVFGSEKTGHVNLVAQLDNLGKGASGAAVQNLDLMLECATR